MTGAIFKETLRRNWRQIYTWGLGIAVLGFYLMVVLPDMEALQGYANLIGSFPPAMLQMMGISDVSVISTPEGFISFGYFGYGVLIFAVYGVIMGLNITANEEDDGILDLVLSLPIARSRVLLERFLAYSLLAITIIAIGFIGIWIGSQVSVLEVSMSRVLEGSLNMIPSTLLIMAFTACMATLVRRKGMATALAAIFVAGSYFLNFFGEAASSSFAGTLRSLSFFAYYNTGEVMRNGLNFVNVVILLAVTVLLVAGSLWFFQRRDVGV
jgi:ABC-2 type transport system permease protein